MIAAREGHSKVVGILLNKGADLSVVDKLGATALFISAYLGHVAVTRMLVNAGANLEAAELQLGWTPLMVAAYNGHSKVVGILLNKGAELSVVDKWGCTALNVSADLGRVAVTRMLVNAGADLEAADSAGSTPLHAAASKGHSEVIRTLATAGANPDSRRPGGETPLFMAAESGHVGVISELLRANANPLFGRMGTYRTGVILPLDAAVLQEHQAVVRELIQQLGIQGCGGASAGANALRWAVQTQQIDVVVMLADAGVIDTRSALIVATTLDMEASVKLLLQQQRGKHMDWDTYVNKQQPDGMTPVVCSIGRAFRSGSQRIVRLFLDAGADTASTVRIVNKEGVTVFTGTPLAYTTLLLRDREAQVLDSMDGRLCNLEAVRRMLLQLEAIRAVSWCWPSDASSCIEQAVHDGTPRAKPTPTADPPLGLTLPRIRRRARARRVLVTAVSR